MSNRHILILRACGLKDEKQECDNIKSQCKLYGLEVHDHCPNTNEDLTAILNNGQTYDYIYLSSHGSADGFASEDGVIDYSWFDFGIQLCSSGCMNEDCIIMLSCCRGGLSQIAYDLFYCCNQIAYIVGPRQSLFPHDMLISFNILLYNLEHRNVDPIVACEKIKLGTDIRFICFDRLETESEPAYIMRIQDYDDTSIAEANEAKEKAKESIEQEVTTIGEGKTL
jgi:hypothetical protein